MPAHPDMVFSNKPFSVLHNTGTWISFAQVLNQLSKTEYKSSICIAVIAFSWYRFETCAIVDEAIAVNKFLDPFFLPPKQPHPELSISNQFLLFFVPYQIKPSHYLDKAERN